MTDGNGKTWTEYLRLTTPLMIFALGVYINFMNSEIRRVGDDVKEINDKLFKHFTNEEIHTPRNMTVSQEAFVVYQTMREKQMDTLGCDIREIKDMIKGRR